MQKMDLQNSKFLLLVIFVLGAWVRGGLFVHFTASERETLCPPPPPPNIENLPTPMIFKLGITLCFSLALVPKYCQKH